MSNCFYQSGSCGYSPPSANNLNVNQGDYCQLGPNVRFNWNFLAGSGSSQSAYQIQIYDNLAFLVIDTCINPSPGTCQSGNTSNQYAQSIGLGYDKNYNSRLRVWDNNNIVSGWLLFPNFVTPRNPYPDPDFICNGEDCSNLRIGEGVIVVLTDNSIVYDGQPGLQRCIWQLPDNSEVVRGDDQNDCEIEVRFVSGRDQAIRLTVEDSNGYSCSCDSQSIDVLLPLPIWKEIAPF